MSVEAPTPITVTTQPVETKALAAFKQNEDEKENKGSVSFRGLHETTPPEPTSPELAKNLNIIA